MHRKVLALVALFLFTLSTAAQAQSGSTSGVRQRLKQAAEAQQNADARADAHADSIIPHPTFYDGTTPIALPMEKLQRYSASISRLKDLPRLVDDHFGWWLARARRVDKELQPLMAQAFQQGKLKSTTLRDCRNVVLDDYEFFRTIYPYEGIGRPIQEYVDALNRAESHILRSGMTAQDTSYVNHTIRWINDHRTLLDEFNEHVDAFYLASFDEDLPIDFYIHGEQLSVVLDPYQRVPVYPPFAPEVIRKNCWLQLPTEYFRVRPYSVEDIVNTVALLNNVLWSEDNQKLTSGRMLEAFGGRLNYLKQIEERYWELLRKNLRKDIQTRARSDEGRALAKLIWCD